MNEPLPCFVCGEKPKVDSFLLMDLSRRGWTCLCPNRHHETNAYYIREDAIAEWNQWVESEGFDDYDWEEDEFEEWDEDDE